LQNCFPIDDVLLHSGEIRDQVACCLKSRQHFMFWAAKFRGKGPPKCPTEFHKSGSPSNTWQSLVTIGQVTWEIRRRKKERSKHQQQNRMPCPYYRKGGHNYSSSYNDLLQQQTDIISTETYQSDELSSQCHINRRVSAGRSPFHSPQPVCLQHHRLRSQVRHLQLHLVQTHLRSTFSAN